MTTIFTEAQEVTLEGTVNGVLGSATDLLGSITGELSGIASAGLNQIQTISDILGFDDITSVLQDGLSNITTLFTSPTNVSQILSIGGYSTSIPSISNIGNINILKTSNTSVVTSSDFTTEGNTPPVYGNYGGPNFAGASPTLVMPSVDYDR